MMKKTKYGRLDYCKALDQWRLVDLDGQEWPILAGQRITLGSLQGIPVHAVLVRDAESWAWAVTDTPTAPAEGGLVSMAIAVQDGDAA